MPNSEQDGGDTTHVESIEGEVMSHVGVVGDDQGIQITAINLRGQSATQLFNDDGQYYLVRQDNE